MLEGDLRDQLGLGTRDQYPAIDEQVEVAKRPMSEHVLKGLTGETPGHEAVEAGDRERAGAGVEVGGPLPCFEPRYLLDEPARVDRVTEARRRVDPEPAPRNDLVLAQESSSPLS